jgi:hypothetical protein
MTDFEIDKIAAMGYDYASGIGVIPVLSSQFEIDCFNAGISNFNHKNNAHIKKIKEGMCKIYIEGSNNLKADKELAIIGA